MTTLRTSQLTAAVTSLILLGSIGLVVSIHYPKLHSLRKEIDTTRAATAGITIEQQNIEELQKQQTALTTAANSLQKEVWLFATEDEFYAHTKKIAEEAQVVIPEPKLSDAVPGSNYQIRTGTLSISGNTSAILKAIDAVTATTPLIAVQQIIFTGGETPSATLTIQTTWQ